MLKKWGTVIVVLVLVVYVFIQPADAPVRSFLSTEVISVVPDNKNGEKAKLDGIYQRLNLLVGEAAEWLTGVMDEIIPGRYHPKKSPNPSPTLNGENPGGTRNSVQIKDGEQMSKQPEDVHGIRQYRSLSEALSDSRIGTMDKLRIGLVANEIKGTEDPAEVRQILVKNRNLIEKLTKKGVLSPQDLQEAEERLKEMEANHEPFKFDELFK